MAILFVLAMLVLCVSCSPVTRGDTVDWPEDGLFQKLPVPKPAKCIISSNDEDGIKATAVSMSAQDYTDYAEACRAAGFTVEEKKDEDSFSAFNAEGYRLKLKYYGLFGEMSVELDAPIPMAQISWPQTVAGKLVPVPASGLGCIKSSYDDAFTIYIGDTDRDAFRAYADRCAEAGFTKDASSGEDWYAAKNETTGHRLRIDYVGFDTMLINLEAPYINYLDAGAQGGASGNGTGDEGAGSDAPDASDEISATSEESQEQYATDDPNAE